ncbi:hypothetical protein DQ04_00031020 [Trypanosoma grayi]|uniref:hypothetical protein n=1 Tax=Trypanosoma grayi TaxID=71804 RepID=UPI0004F46AD9|nr:hypothetical protein DQ04_00031020 [Trypanosoma grayi]KEG15568.1 hypothetical protein DQ04_00031020 [Trypanosoma grayi]
MEEDNLRDLMNRLRFATGKAAEAPLPEAASASIGDQCLLVLQQSLRRHPALVDAHKSRDELKRGIMEQLKRSIQADVAPSNDVSRLQGWINEVSDALEIERLSAVYREPEQVHNEAQQRILEELGFETLPQFSQFSVDDLSPWNLLLTLVSGPLLSVDEVRHRRMEMHIPNPTPAMVSDLVEINNNVYCTTSWLSLLNSLGEFPIKTVRHVWLAAVYFFPTSGPVVAAYLRREIDELAKRRCLWDEQDEDDAKETYRSYCRVLNCFFRHLPLCFSVDLFNLFFDFLECYIKPDDSALDNVFRTALQRDIGHCPASTDIWKQYIRWKGDRIHDMQRRREWVRKMYVRVLRTPLNNLQDVKEDYDYFLRAEYRGRPPSEGRLEERFVRAKGAASEINRFLMTLQGGWTGGMQNGDVFPKSLYLPRPVKLRLDNRNNMVDDKEENMQRLEVELWSLWTSLIDRETVSSAYAGIELFGYERLRFFLAMRSSSFPHQAFCWISYTDYCLGQQPLLSEGERQLMARGVLEKASFLLPRNFYMQVAYCDYMLREVADSECAHRTIKGLLTQQRQLVVDYIKKQPLVSLDKALTALENITLLSVNWMRWGSLDKTVTNTQYVRLVARFTMHRVDFLSLIMGVVRRASREDRKFTPHRCQHAFNTFCHFWIKLELIRNQSKEEAVIILQRWKDHLKMFLSSAKDRGWSLVDCGVDEYFISSCSDICHSHPQAVGRALGFMEEVRLTAVESCSFCLTELEALVETTRRLRDTFFVLDSDANSLSSSKLPLHLFSMRLRGATVPLQTYDHHLFSAECAWHEGEMPLLQVEKPSEEGCFNGTASQGPLEAMPDDARWAPHIQKRAFPATEGAPNGSRMNTGHEVKWKKIRRPPNRRVLVTKGALMKDLSFAVHAVESGMAGAGPALRRVEEMLTVQMPSVYETDILFLDKTVNTGWLLEFLERMPALQ